MPAEGLARGNVAAVVPRVGEVVLAEFGPGDHVVAVEGIGSLLAGLEVVRDVLAEIDALAVVKLDRLARPPSSRSFWTTGKGEWHPEEAVARRSPTRCIGLFGCRR